MSDLLEYKGFQGTVKFSKTDNRLFGHVLHIESTIIYHGVSVEDIQKAFNETIDAYLEFCASTNKVPNKPFSGNFNVRITPALHKAAANVAAKSGQKLNGFVADAIASEVEARSGHGARARTSWVTGNVTSVFANQNLAPGQAANQGGSFQPAGQVGTLQQSSIDELVRQHTGKTH